MRNIASVLADRPSLIDDINRLVTPESLLQVLRSVADTPAPSGTSSLTRGAVIQSWFESRQLEHAGAVLRRDAFESGCDVLTNGEGGIGILAHLDEVSYLLREPVRPGLWQVTPYCYHLAEEPTPARVVRFAPDGTWSVLCHAQISLEEGQHLVSHPVEVELRPGDRVVLATPLAHDPDTGRVTGSLDNAAGVAAALLASETMLRCGIAFSTYLTDEEEGPSGAASQTISRGAARLLSRLDPAPLTVAVDIHGLSSVDLQRNDNFRRPWGASLAEYSSRGKGSVARPDIYASLVQALEPLSSKGIHVRANVGGHVPRSDDVVAMLHSNRVVILGYPGENRHFDRGLPATNLQDLVDLARALVVVGAMVHPSPGSDRS
ncbi:hypothetical protein [Phycicoccus sp. Root101]|uniref:hypothetical protein n=1 Tax=Phycicoccus sp. Root101 TaxID=1736421 RepID=UPI00070323CE|nr:hypothetical protein [Phycicoccus sp. Root101]KQU64128.1 hypothetical protein ASC58_19650 [Phycicoccus sp. Root101]